MRRNINRPIRSTVSQIAWGGMALYALAMGVYGCFLVRQGLMTGRVYSLAVVVGSSNMVYRNSSPAGYWIIISLYIFGCIAGIALAAMQSCEIAAEHKRKVAAKNSQEKESGDQ